MVGIDSFMYRVFGGGVLVGEGLQWHGLYTCIIGARLATRSCLSALLEELSTSTSRKVNTRVHYIRSTFNVWSSSSREELVVRMVPLPRWFGPYIWSWRYTQGTILERAPFFRNSTRASKLPTIASL